jgi:hypothetical protein
MLGAIRGIAFRGIAPTAIASVRVISATTVSLPTSVCPAGIITLASRAITAKLLVLPRQALLTGAFATTVAAVAAHAGTALCMQANEGTEPNAASKKAKHWTETLLGSCVEKGASFEYEMPLDETYANDSWQA